MSPDLLFALARVFGSVALLIVVLWGVSRLARATDIAPELGRKLVHISLGLYCLTFPWIFSAAWEVALMCALSVGVFALARNAMRARLGEGLHGVERVSFGEIFFAVSVALLFWLSEGHFILLSGERAAGSSGTLLYVLPIAILTLCDAASALVGVRYGTAKFHVEDGLKSVEGVVAFAVTAWLVSMIAILLLSEVGRSEVILLAFIVAAFGALLEAASWRGLDNLFIPMGLYFLLASLMHLGAVGLALVAGPFLLALLGLLYLTQHVNTDRHFLATGATLFFCIAAFSGPMSTITPALAVGAYLVCRRYLDVDRPEHDGLNLLVVVLAIALCFFVVSNLARMDTIFAFNLAFAALAAGVVARFGANMQVLLACVVVAWGAMSIRTYWSEGGGSAASLFTSLGLAAIMLVAAAGWVFREKKLQRPWVSLGALSTAAGMAALPLSP